MNKFSILILINFIFTMSCKNDQNMTTDNNIDKIPSVKKIKKKLEIHNDVRNDNYFWLNNREDKEVIAYLNEENTYTKASLKHTEKFQKNLFEEMKGRIKKDDASVPYKKNGYWYITKYEKGKDYPIYLRKKEHLNAVEEILFDCNEMAKGHSYFQLGGVSISPDNQFASFSVDTVSRRQYTLYIKDLKTGAVFPDKIENTTAVSYTHLTLPTTPYV